MSEPATKAEIATLLDFAPVDCDGGLASDAEQPSEPHRSG